MNTMLIVDNRLLGRLRALMREEGDADERSELATAVQELLDAGPKTEDGEHEYGFEVDLRGVLRTRATDATEGYARLLAFQDVDTTVDYDGVTLTQVSLVPRDVRLVDVDGIPVGGR